MIERQKKQEGGGIFHLPRLRCELIKVSGVAMFTLYLRQGLRVAKVCFLNQEAMTSISCVGWPLTQQLQDMAR